MKKKVLSVFLVLAMVLSVLPMSVFAAENESITYIDRSWDGEKVVETEKECTDYVVVTADTTVFEAGKWYVASGTVVNPNRIVVTGADTGADGAARLILTDGCRLETAGINVGQYRYLQIYGQSGDSGELIACDTTNRAAIGGGNKDYASQIEIFGGRITAKAADGAAIGSGANVRSMGEITIYGGFVTAESGSGAGIGGGKGADNSLVIIGSGSSADALEGFGGTVTINGGIVNASGSSGAGIGGGFHGKGGYTTINGGFVTASSETGAGIGGGYEANSQGILSVASDAVITAGDSASDAVVMTADDCQDNECRYVCVNCALSVSYVERSWDGQKVVETVRSQDGVHAITGSTVTLEDGKWYAVMKDVTVNTRLEVSGTANVILCDGMTLEAAEGINVGAGNALNVYGQRDDCGRLVASGSAGTAAIGGGMNFEGACGSVSIFGGTVTASGGASAAGIGGGFDGDGSSVVIYGGTVHAEGDKNAAGIGGGFDGDGGSVVIYDGTVTAVGGLDGAGIGGGWDSKGADVAVYGGSVTAIAGDRDPGYAEYDLTPGKAIGGGAESKGHGTLTLGDKMALKAGNETPGTGMTVEEYRQTVYKYAEIYEDVLAKGENWFINGDGVLYITGEVQNNSTTTDYTQWLDYKSQITAVVAKDGAKVTNCDRLFSNCANLKSVDIAKLDITGTTSMRYMFSGCSSLESLDLSTLDTSAVTTMQCMFYNASALKSIKLNGWNTENVNDMQYMFRNCASLTSLDLSSFNTAKVTTFYTTFYQCSKLETLDISNFSSDSLTRTDYVFDSCPALKEIAINGNALQKLASPISALSSAWYNKDNGTEYNSAAQLQTVEGKVVLTKTKPLTYIERSWDGKKVVETVKVVNDFIVVDENTTIFEGGKWYVVNSDVTNGNRIIVSGTANLILCDGFTLTLTKGIKCEDGNTLNFYGQSNDSGLLSAISKGVEYAAIGADIHKSGNINFYGGSVHAEADWVARGAGIGGGHYAVCGKISVYGGNIYAKGSREAAGIGSGFRTAGGDVTIYGGNVTAIGGADGAGIGNGDCGSRFDTQNAGKVTIYGGTVNATGGKHGAGIGGGNYGSGADLKIYGGTVTAQGGENGIAIGIGYCDPIDWGYLETGTLTLGDKMTLKAGHEAADTQMTPKEYYQVGYRYAHVYDDTIANGENWYITCDGVLYIIGPVENTSSAGSDNAPWKDYKSQITAVVAMDGAAVTNCDCLFSDCENLKSVDIAKLDITGTTSMRYMFSGCPSLESLDLSTLDTSAVTSMMCMFYNASGLKSINVSGWNTSNVNDMQYMFNNCASLTELDLGSFDTSKVTTVYTMFYKCSNLEKLNIGNFSGDKLTSTDFVLSSCPALAEITVNGNALQKLAEPIISAGVVPVWYNNVTTEKYQTTDDLKAIEGKVTLVKSVPFLFDSVSLVLSGELGLNFYTVINDVEAVKDGYMLFEIGNKVETQAVYFTDAVLVDGRYVFRCNVNALQMADAITVSFHYGDVTVGPKTTSVASYIDKLIAKHNNDDTDPTVKLAKSILNYGHYAQLALAETRNIKLGEDYAVTDNLSYVTIANASDLEAYKATKTGSIDGITKVSRSLSLDHGTDINLYLTVKDEYVPNVTVADKNGNAVDFTLEKTGSRYMLVIPQIAAHQLGDTYTVSVDDGAMTVKVSALSYAYSVLSSEKTDAQKLCVSALYEYYTAAITYRNAQ